MVLMPAYFQTTFESLALSWIRQRERVYLYFCLKMEYLEIVYKILTGICVMRLTDLKDTVCIRDNYLIFPGKAPGALKFTHCLSMLQKVHLTLYI